MGIRYDNGADWVEIAGVARKPMRALLRLDADDLSDAHKFAVGVTTDAHFTDENGEVVDWQTDVLGLSIQQWQWWKARIWAAAREEKVSPEA